MSGNSTYLKSTSVYMFATIINLAASIISFPILTRLLTVSEYGILSLFNTIILFGVGISKLGLQNSIIRFYPEFLKKDQLSVFFSTFTICNLCLCLIVNIIGNISVFLFPITELRLITILVLFIVLLRSFESTFLSYLRCEDKSLLFAATTVLSKYAILLTGLYLLIYKDMGVIAIFWGEIYIAPIFILFFILFYCKRFKIHLKNISKKLFKSSLKYGAPLALFEMASIILALSDRFIIQVFCGNDELGLYSAAYNLCMYIAIIVRQPLELSIIPIYLRIWEFQGKEKTLEFLSKVYEYVFLVVLPLFWGFIAIQSDFISLVASSKYSSCTDIIPVILFGLLLNACFPIFAAGYFIKKHTKELTIIVYICCFANILLNIILIPYYGIKGAAWSTALSYIGFVGTTIWRTHNFLLVKIPFKKIFIYNIGSIIMFLVVGFFNNLNIYFQITFGVITYSIFILIFDRGNVKLLLINQGFIKKY